MGYCLEYQTRNNPNLFCWRRCRIAMMTVLCILLFVFTVNLFWPRGAELLEEFLFPKSSAIAVVAVEELAMDLEDGLPVGTAITSFLNKLEGK